MSQRKRVWEKLRAVPQTQRFTTSLLCDSVKRDGKGWIAPATVREELRVAEAAGYVKRLSYMRDNAYMFERTSKEIPHEIDVPFWRTLSG
jgi:Fe2+ or Zn2+ uptake regulation protein